MAQDDERAALMSAMTTEHFVMQTALSVAVNEQGGRASMYLYSLSGALVAMGFMADGPGFLPFVAAVLPAIFVLGPVLAERELGGVRAWATITAAFGIGSGVLLIAAALWLEQRCRQQRR